MFVLYYVKTDYDDTTEVIFLGYSENRKTIEASKASIEKQISEIWDDFNQRVEQYKEKVAEIRDSIKAFLHRNKQSLKNFDKVSNFDVYIDVQSQIVSRFLRNNVSRSSIEDFLNLEKLTEPLPVFDLMEYPLLEMPPQYEGVEDLRIGEIPPIFP